MEAVKKRIDWVDTGKYICIMFVMLSHLQSGSEALTKLYTPFFLSGFFFLSGYVHKQPHTFRDHFAKKARGLLLPWFCFGTGNILLSRLMNFGSGENYLAKLGWNFLQVRGMGDEVWFVAALFVAFLPFYFFAKAKHPGRALGLMFLLFCLSDLYTRYVPGDWFPWGTNNLPWHLEFVFLAGFWMLLGYDFRRYGEKWFDQWNSPINRTGLWLGYLLLVWGPESALWLERIRAVPGLDSAVGILAVVSLCKLVKSNGYIRFVGANTLTYFALHGWVYATAELVLTRFAGGFYGACLGNPLYSSLLAVGITLVVSVVLMVPAEIINRYFPWVLGRKGGKHGK